MSVSAKSVFQKSVIALVCASTISGCGIINGFKQSGESYSTARKTAEQARAELDRTARDGVVQNIARPRIAGEEIRKASKTLPDVFRTRVTYQTLGAQTLETVARSVSGLVGVPIRMFEALDGETSSASSSSASTTPNFASSMVTFQMQGTFQDFLDEVAATLDVSWRYNEKVHQVEFFRFETKAISVMLPPGEKSISASINLNGGGGGGGGGGSGGTSPSGSVSVDHNLDINPWESIMGGVQGILQAQGGSGTGSSGGSSGGGMTAQGKYGYAVANPELGMITVRARPQFVQRVAEYVETINRRFASNVLIDVRVLEVSMDNNAAAGMNFSFLKERLGEAALSVVSSDIIQPAGGVPGRITLDTNSSDGSFVTKTVVDALSQVGNVSLQSQGQVIAINGQPAPFQQAREINYVESSSTTVVPDVGATTSVQQGTRVVGFTANFLPLIMGDNRILLQYQMQTSSLLAMKQINSGGNVTQLPEIASQSLQQQAFLHDGQTIMLFGFEQAKAEDKSANGVFSLSRSTTANKSMTVVLIQVRTAVQQAGAVDIQKPMVVAAAEGDRNA